MIFPRIPAADAYKQTARSNSSKWPSRQSPARLEPVCLPDIAPTFSLEPGEPVFTIGSCFARHIELALRGQGYEVPALDFTVPSEELWTGTKMVPGILNKYTPFSMLNEVQFALGNTDGAKFLIEVGDDRYLDGQLHTNVAVSRERGLQRRAELRDLYRRALSESRIVIVTLGLTEAWWDDEEQVYLNDTAQKSVVGRHPGRFYFEVLSPESHEGGCGPAGTDAIQQSLAESAPHRVACPVRALVLGNGCDHRELLFEIRASGCSGSGASPLRLG